MDNPTNRYIVAAAIVLVSIATASLAVSMAVLAIQQTSSDRYRVTQTDSEKTLTDVTNQLEIMQAQLNALETKTQQADSGRPADNSNLTRTTPSPTGTRPTSTPYVPKNTTNICHRTPKVQGIIIETLSISSCRVITNQELFRITNLEIPAHHDELKPGDFEGLANLVGLHINLRYGQHLPPDTFQGLQSLQTLQINISGSSDTEPQPSQVHPDTFRGLENLTSLKINASIPNNTESPFTLPPFKHLPNLRDLNIQVDNHDFLPVPDQFSNLPQLTTLNLYTPHAHSPALPQSPYTLPEGIFQNNPQLTNVRIHLRYESPTPAISFRKNTFQNLDYLEGLSLPQGQGTELALSPTSPLLKAIINQKQRPPEGYLIVPSEDR